MPGAQIIQNLLSCDSLFSQLCRKLASHLAGCWFLTETTKVSSYFNEDYIKHMGNFSNSSTLFIHFTGDLLLSLLHLNPVLTYFFHKVILLHVCISWYECNSKDCGVDEMMKHGPLRWLRENNDNKWWQLCEVWMRSGLVEGISWGDSQLNGSIEWKTQKCYCKHLQVSNSLIHNVNLIFIPFFTWRGIHR